jgi:hypothetical protein
MKKQLQRNYSGLIALLSVFVLTFLGLGACMNPLQSPEERGPDGSTGVRISIVNGEERTLLPSLSFSKYVLNFSTDASVTIPGDVTLTGVNTGIIALDPADWTIKVTAYVDNGGGDVAVAEGSAQVSLTTEAPLKELSIRVSSKTDGANGSFSYSVQYPADVSDGYLYVYDSGGTQVIYRYLLNDPSGDNISLAPGYYRLRVYLYTNYGIVNRTEIVHIYPELETRGDYDFSEADFGSPIEISGTVDLSGLDSIIYAEIGLYENSEFNYREGYYDEYYPSDTWNWTAHILPFNRPTDLYVELRIRFSSGDVLTKRLELPLSVYDQDLSAPDLGPFTVNRFDLSGIVDFSELDALGITYYSADVSVYQDSSTPALLGNPSVDFGDGSWSLGIISEEVSLPVRIVLRVYTYGGAVYDEIQTSLLESRSDLDFTPAPVSAGTAYNGVGIGSGYRYWFVPETAGTYAFKVSGGGSQWTYLYLYNSSGSYLSSASGNPDATLFYNLDAGAAYYIQLDLNSPYRAFQFRVNPVSQVSLGGTVDLSGLLASLEGVSVTDAEIRVYADNGAHTLLGTSTINPNDGSWSIAAVNLDETSAPAVFVIAAALSNGNTIYHQEYRDISGSNNSLDFSPAALTGESEFTRTTVNNYDYFLYVPAETGDYSFTVSAGPDRNMTLTMYDAQTGNHLRSVSGYGELELVQRVEEGKPYRIYASSSSAFETYRLRTEVLEMVSLSGTVDFSGLAPLTSDDIHSTEIIVYTDAYSPSQLGSSVMVESDGSWSASIPASGTRAVLIQAYIYPKNGWTITDHRRDTISGDTSGLDLAPTAVSPAAEPLTRVSGYNGDLFLLVPSESGFFKLEAIDGNGTPLLYVYDPAAGAYQDGSGSLYAELSAGSPYVVQVYSGSLTAYQFRLSAVSPTGIGGSVDYSGLPASISSRISSARVSAYLDNPAHTQIVSNALVAEGSWSALVPADAVGQPVRLVLTVDLNTGSLISQIQTVLEESASDLDFVLSVAASETNLNGKTTLNGYDQFLFIPPSGGDFTLQAGSGNWTRIYVYDGLTGNQIGSSPQTLYTTELTLRLTAENPYIILVYNWQPFWDYQFYAEPPANLDVSANFSSLSSWTTESAEILIFSGSGYTDPEIVTFSSPYTGGEWPISASLTGADVFIALVGRSSNGEGVLNTAADTIPSNGDDLDISFTPVNTDKNLSTGAWHDLSTDGSDRGTWLLWIPPSAGAYALSATSTAIDTYMYLYDGLSGNVIGENDDDSTSTNSRIQNNDFEAGHPYLIRVKNAHIGTPGGFQFKATAVSP